MDFGVPWLDSGLAFPSASCAHDDGLVAVGGDLCAERLVAAYRHGVFPWPVDDLPVLWFSPNPRLLLVPSRVHVSRSLRKLIKKGLWRVSFDTCFERVITRCATIPRKREQGTWIRADIVQAYCRLHDLGLAHSVEVWNEARLVGGLYGVAIGAAFFGESMFAEQANASKVALVELAHRLSRYGYLLIDCQIVTNHLRTMGARPWHRAAFLDKLKIALETPTLQGCWTNTDRINATVSC